MTNVFINTEELNIFYRYSSLSRLKQVNAYVLRLKYNVLNPKLKKHGPLEVDKLDIVMKSLLRLMHHTEFAPEIQALKSNREIREKSRLQDLCVSLDENNIIRVGERLRNVSIPYAQKHSVVLPPNTN